MKKQLILGLILLLMTMGLTGCGGSGENSQPAVAEVPSAITWWVNDFRDAYLSANSTYIAQTLCTNMPTLRVDYNSSSVATGVDAFKQYLIGDFSRYDYQRFAVSSVAWSNDLSDGYTTFNAETTVYDNTLHKTIEALVEYRVYMNNYTGGTWKAYHIYASSTIQNVY